MRHVTSCTTCRQRKKRCIQARAESACVFCSSKGLECDIVHLGQQKLGRDPKQGPVALRPAPLLATESVVSCGEDGAADLSTDEVSQPPPYDETIELYFDLFHNKQQILFHRRTFLSMRDKNQVPMYLLLGIVALVARFSKHDYFQGTAPLERAKPYLAQALLLFNTRAEAVSIQALQASILLSFVCFVEDEDDQSALLAAQATCLVQLLNLPERHTLCAAQRETNIRLFWQAWMMDTWNSTWDHRPRQLSAKQEYPKPLIEDVFEDMTSEDGTTRSTYVGPREPSDEGIWTKVVELTETLAEAMQFLKSVVEQPEDGTQAELKTHRLALELRSWNRNLPEHLQHTLQNHERFRMLGRGREFAVLHLIFHYQCMILFFPYLAKSLSTDKAQIATDLFEEPSRNYANCCRAHAQALSELMWTTNTTPGMECLWSPVNGHFLVVASTVHLHSLLFDQTALDIANYKTLLEQNFVMLLQLQKYWPTLKYSLSRLEAIHKACERGHGSKAFEMDAWMLAFLGNYGSAVTERHAATEQLQGAAEAAEAWQETCWAEGLNWLEMTAKATDVDSELNAFLTFN